MSHKWFIHNSSLLYRYCEHESPRDDSLLALDIDNTIIKPKQNRTFPKDKDDWQFTYDTIPGILAAYYRKGTRVIFISNQLRIGSRVKSTKEWIEKIDKVIKAINIPIEVYAAIRRDNYRKPNPGILEELHLKYNFDKDKSLFVGDAAGRITDFSNSDKLLAQNFGIRFSTPELFLHYS